MDSARFAKSIGLVRALPRPNQVLYGGLYRLHPPAVVLRRTISSCR